MGRRCATCNRDLLQSSHTANQWSKGAGGSRCARCVHRHLTAGRSGSSHQSGRYNISTQSTFNNTDLMNPFAEGAFRLVAKGKYVSGPRSGQTCIAKWFKTGAVFSAVYFSLDIKASDKALEIVNKFNQLNIVNKMVKINAPEVWTFKHGHWAGRKVLSEPFIQNYQKFNSNSGWNDDSMTWGKVMQALSHFSYHISGGHYVLCDLQGGIYQREVILSDPVILSQKRDFGVTDLGPSGISSFFTHHKCNGFCRPTWIKPGNPTQRFRAVPGTTMIRHTVSTRHSRPAGTRY